jgi:hypothetical protein
MSAADNAELHAFAQTLTQVARNVGWQLEEMREHALFRELLAVHCARRIRGWLILVGLRLARQVALDECPAYADAWLGSGVLQRLCENADYLVERIAS